MKQTNKRRIVILQAVMALLLLLVTGAVHATDATHHADSLKLEELKAENELLQQRSRFTTGGIAMILGIGAILVFLVVNNRWNHRLEVKNRQLQRERNVTIAQNKQLAIERDRAEAALRAKTAFMQSMTHEIRTPLNAISGFSQVLTMPDIDLLDEERFELSQRIQENTRLLTNIIDDLILISDLESRVELPVPKACNISDLATEAIEKTRELVAPAVLLRSRCSLADDQSFMSYPRMIQSILKQLLDNAAKFTREGSITLTVDRENDNLHFAVIDTGPGIPPDKKEYIFERFSKLDSFAQGTGLGLSIARMIAERLGGTLTLDTSRSSGSKFDLIIPIQQNA